MSRPTPKEVAESRAYFERLLHRNALASEDVAHARVLLAATESPTSKEIAYAKRKYWSDEGEEPTSGDIENAINELPCSEVEFVVTYFLGKPEDSNA